MIAGSASATLSKVSARLIRVSISGTEAQACRISWMRCSKAGNLVVAVLVIAALRSGMKETQKRQFLHCYRFATMAVNCPMRAARE